MKPKHQRLLIDWIICQHSRSDPITSTAIARIVHTDPRTVRAHIQHLVLAGELIGALAAGTATTPATKRTRPGYFPIRCIADLEAVRNVLRSRLALIAARDRALLKAWQKHTGRVIQPLLPTMEAPQ